MWRNLYRERTKGTKTTSGQRHIPDGILYITKTYISHLRLHDELETCQGRVPQLCLGTAEV